MKKTTKDKIKTQLWYLISYAPEDKGQKIWDYVDKAFPAFIEFLEKEGITFKDKNHETMRTMSQTD